MPRRVPIATLSAVILTLSGTVAFGWDATFPDGPVRESAPTPSTAAQPLSHVRLVGPTHPASAALADSILAVADFGTRTIPYPTAQGLSLGTGWDLVVNQKQYASCIDFETSLDKDYQTAALQLEQVTDDDTLDISLNMEFSGSAGGNISGIGAKAAATTSMNGSHHIASTDISFTAHASVTSGVIFAGTDSRPTTDSGSATTSVNAAVATKSDGSITAVRLTSDMAKLAETNPDAFRRKCGDGFVSALGNGADLYLLLHFHDLLSEDKSALSFDSNASAGVSDVFSASGKSNLKTTMDRLSHEKKLDISFVQEGGKIELLPTTLDEAAKQVEKLPSEEFTNPRHTFAVITPYSALPNWPPYYLIDTSDLRQRAIRYVERLNSIIFEALNIRDNLYRDRADGGSDKYYYYYRHQLRAERPAEVADKALIQRQSVLDGLRKLDAPPCSTAPIGTSYLDSAASPDQSNLAQQSDTKLSKIMSACQDIEKELENNTDSFNDLKLWVELPIPLNAITNDTLVKLDDLKGDLQDRKTLFAQNVFRHWVERADQIRCRLFGECLSGDDRKALYDGIFSKLTGVTAPPPVWKTIRICISEHDAECRAFDQGFGCNYNGQDQRAGAIACSVRGLFLGRTRRISSESMSACGRTIAEVGCYSYAVQPALPNGP